MRNKKNWLNDDGTQKEDKDLQSICKEWSLSDWEAFLKKNESSMKEENLDYYNQEEMMTNEDYESSFLQTIEVKHYPAFIKRIRKIVNSLTPRQRQIIVMLFWQGLSKEEVSKSLGISTSTIRVLIKRAFDRMKTQICKQKKIHKSNNHNELNHTLSPKM